MVSLTIMDESDLRQGRNRRTSGYYVDIVVPLEVYETFATLTGNFSQHVGHVFGEYRSNPDEYPPPPAEGEPCAHLMAGHVSDSVYWFIREFGEPMENHLTRAVCRYAEHRSA